MIGDYSVGSISLALPCGCSVGLADDTNGHMGSLPNPWIVKLCTRHASMDVLIADAYAAGRAQAIAEAAAVAARRSGELIAGAQHAGNTTRGKLLAQASSEIDLVSDRIRALLGGQ